MSDDTALIVVDQLNPAVIFSSKDEVTRILEEIKKKALAHVPDTETVQGRKDIASMAFKVARSKTLLDEMGKKKAEKAKKEVDETNALRKIIRDTLDPLKDEVRKPLTDWEAEEEKRKAELARIEEARVNGIRQKIEAIRQIPNQITLSTPAIEIHDVLAAWESTEPTKAEFEEFLDSAMAARAEVICKLRDAYDARVKFEAEELARRAESERLAKVAAEQAAEAERLAELARIMEEERRIEGKRIADQEEAARLKAKAEADALKKELDDRRSQQEEADRYFKAERDKELAAIKKDLDWQQAIIDNQKFDLALEKARIDMAEAAKARAADEERWRSRLLELSSVGANIGWNGQEAFDLDDNDKPLITYEDLVNPSNVAYLAAKASLDKLVAGRKIEAEKAKAKAEAERIAREAELRPDKKKLSDFAEAILSVAVPGCFFEQSNSVLDSFLDNLRGLVSEFKAKIEAL